jgi:hypothetical protein
MHGNIKEIAGLVVLVSTIGLVSWWAVTNLGNAPTKPQVETQPTGKEARPSAAQQPSATGQPSAEPSVTLLGEIVDTSRLYDRTFENDPQIQRLARKTGVPAGCLIASWKMALYQEEIPDGVCAGNLTSSVHFIDAERDHPYNQYSNEQLRALAAQSSPEAAIILARREANVQESKQLYEQAVVLAGTGTPLVEWMTTHDTGGMIHEGDQLDVKRAKVGYEVYLVVHAIEAEPETAITVEAYREELLAAGVDVEPIERRAAEYFEQLTAQRHAISNSGWEQQP